MIIFPVLRGYSVRVITTAGVAAKVTLWAVRSMRE
jgi:hypothetical protein